MPNARVREMNNNAADIRYYTDGSRAREKEDHLSSTVFQPQDETSVSGVRRKNPFSLNCLVNPEVVRAGAELCKRRRDEANSTTSL